MLGGFIMGIMSRAALMISFSSLFMGCETTPCEQYCETFVERTSQCRVGGPSGEEGIEECENGVSQDTCDKGDSDLKRLSCQEFAEHVCSRSNAIVYDCPSR
jgi:hypothetical protein